MQVAYYVACLRETAAFALKRGRLPPGAGAASFEVAPTAEIWLPELGACSGAPPSPSSAKSGVGASPPSAWLA